MSAGSARAKIQKAVIDPLPPASIRGALTLIVALVAVTMLALDAALYALG
jgi:hypothetical protein